MRVPILMHACGSKARWVAMLFSLIKVYKAQTPIEYICKTKRLSMCEIMPHALL